MSCLGQALACRKAIVLAYGALRRTKGPKGKVLSQALAIVHMVIRLGFGRGISWRSSRQSRNVSGRTKLSVGPSEHHAEVMIAIGITRVDLKTTLYKCRMRLTLEEKREEN